ncbi:unnamed protein product [Prorocentrum cordatum]|uniref:Uncharacterized protein n=1 Tax=Prorocentrum cordatum TaxID=2364126 RepID=A0ABN9SPU6_9DINO|nr:unnamed protein product [Polarella glacialis]
MTDVTASGASGGSDSLADELRAAQLQAAQLQAAAQKAAEQAERDPWARRHGAAGAAAGAHDCPKEPEPEPQQMRLGCGGWAAEPRGGCDGRAGPRASRAGRPRASVSRLRVALRSARPMSQDIQ